MSDTNSADSAVSVLMRVVLAFVVLFIVFWALMKLPEWTGLYSLEGENSKWIRDTWGVISRVCFWESEEQRINGEAFCFATGERVTEA